MKIYKSLLLLLTLGATITSASAQSYYDDDIYFDASKTAKENKSAKSNSSAAAYTSATGGQCSYVQASDGTVYVVDAEGNAYPTSVQNFPGSDLYTVYSNNERDVDEYNRRYTFADSTAVDSIYRDAFANTRNIERFSNPDIVTGSGDQQLIDYYSSVQPAEINIYVDTPLWYGLYSPYYTPYHLYSSLYWNPWYWDPWYYPGWYGYPYYSWSWGWGHGWGPAWGPAWGPGPGGHHAWHHPQSSPGSYRPHRPGATTAHRGSATNNYRGGTTTGTRNNSGYRPSSRNNSNVGNVNSLGGTRPSYNGGTRTGGDSRSGIGTGGGRTGGSRSSGTYNSSNSSSRSSSPSYRSSNGGGSRSSSGTRSGGGGSRGGSRGGGGGGRR